MGMRLGAVEIPDALVDAHRDGKLVLFVGAGVSVAAPSNLPTFRGLVDRIAAESGRRCPDGGSSPDQVLDRLKDDGVDVHLRVREIIGCGDSKPNPLHEAIIDLATTSGKPGLSPPTMIATFLCVLKMSRSKSSRRRRFPEAKTSRESSISMGMWIRSRSAWW